MAELLQNIKELEALESGKHWFCCRNDGSDKSKDPDSDVRERQQKVFDAFMIFSYDGDQAEEPKKSLASGITRNLSRCEVCIASYYLGKKKVLDGLREEGFEDEQIDIFAGIFDDQAIDRIERGLKRASSTLQALSKDQRRTRALSRSELMAICEALYCERFLSDEHRLSALFDEPFSLCQENERLATTTATPALARFAFSANQARRKWALTGWEQHPMITGPDQFDLSMRPAISQALSLACVVPIADNEFAVRFWTAMSKMVPCLSAELITHSLRNMEVDVCKLILDYLNQDGPTFQPLLQTITCFLQHAPKDFWDAMGAVSPPSIIEGIFHNSQYDRAITSSFSGEAKDVSHVEYLLTWVRPFMESVSSSNQPPACRSLTTQLLRRFQGQNYPEQARERWQRAGINVLKWALLIRLQDHTASSDAVGRATGSDLLGILSGYLDHFLDLIARRSEQRVPASTSDLCRELVQAALTLECRLLRIDHQALSKPQHLTQSSARQNLEVWKKVVARANTIDTALIEAALPATMELSDLGQFGPKGDAAFTDEKTRFNAQFKECIGLMCQIFERVGEMSSQQLRQFVSADNLRPAFIAALLSSEEQLYEATIDIIKNMSGAQFREDAIRELLQFGLAGALGDFASAIDRIRDSRRFYACPRMLKTAGDIITILCDAHDGLLRGVTLDSGTQSQVLRYWKSQWSALTVIYRCTEEWSVHQDRNSMKEFCRDTMQFSEKLFDNYVVFANVITGTESGETTPSGQLLKEPLRTMDWMVAWLRLKDEYLASKAVAILPQVMEKLDSSELETSERVKTYLSRVIDGGTKTILSFQQKARLAKALYGDDYDKHASKVAVPTQAENSATAPPQKLPRTKSAATSKLRTGTIVMEAWQANSKVGNTGLVGSKPTTAYGEDKQAAQEESAIRKASKTSLPMKREPKVKQDMNAMAAFIQQRKKEKLEKVQRDQALTARLRNQDPTSLAGQLAGAGSNLAGLGNMKKDRTRITGGMMVSSDEESDSEDDFDQALFGGAPKASAAKGSEILRQRPVQPRGPVKKMKQARSAQQMKARLAPPLAPLHRQILSWDLFQGGDFPSGSARTDYSLVTESFRTPNDYQKTFEPLLLLEAWQGFQQAREEGWGKPLSIKVGSRLSVDALVEVNVTLDMAEFKDLGIGETDILLLSKEKTPDTSPGRCLARVHKLGKRKPKTVEVSIRISPDSNSLLSSLSPNCEIFGYKITSLTPLEREYGALLGLQYYDLCDEIIKAVPSPLLAYSQEKVANLCRMYDMNPAQAKAVQSAVDNDAFTLIQGPPGSGKTKTIVSIVGALLTESLDRSKGVSIAQPRPTGNAASSDQQATAPKKLLVCAPSNAAVDELVMRLMNGVKTYSGQSHTLNVVRLGRSDRINAKVAGVTLDELVNQKLELTEKQDEAPDEMKQAMDQHKATHEEINKLRLVFDEAASSGRSIDPEQRLLMEKLHRQKKSLSTKIDNLKDSGNTRARNSDIRRRQVQQEILNSAHVLCATLSGSGHDMFHHLNVDFETVVIDEAAQSVELSALIPLKYGCQKCIMVGDPKQLPPTVLSREAARFQYEQSLFVRMQSNKPGDVHLLDTQYRMHPEISVFPSQAFYDGRLLDGGKMAELRRKDWHQDAYLGPYHFFDVQGSHQSGPRGHSLTNPAEVEIAVQLYQRLRGFARSYDFSGKIGIITPYKAQLQRLRDRFRREYGEEVFSIIDFNTTDAFQGRESEVIIFSCVRASNKGIGFLSDIRRMNVGITRAKCSLWVLGNATSLEQGEYWKKLIDNARQRTRFVTGDVSKLINGPAKLVSGNSNSKLSNTVSVKAEVLSDTAKHIKSEFEDKMDLDEAEPTAPIKTENTKAKVEPKIEPKEDAKRHLNTVKRRRSSSETSESRSRASSKTPRTMGAEQTSIDNKSVPLAERAAAIERAAAQQNGRNEGHRPPRPPIPGKKKHDAMFIQPKRR